MIYRVEPHWDERMPIFLSPAWLSSQSPDYGWLSDRSEPGGRVIPFVIRSRALFRWIQFQFGVWSPLGLAPDESRVFLGNVAEWCRVQRFDFVAAPLNAALFDAAPSGATSAPFGSYVLDLTRSENELWAGVHHQHRNLIRRAKNSGITVEWSPDLADEAHSLMAATMARSGLAPLGATTLGRIVRTLGEHVDVGVARAGASAQACVVVPWSGHGAYCLYAGTVDSPATGASHLLQWEAMLRAQARGVERYDLMGVRLRADPESKFEGIKRFKRHFGGELVTGCLWKMSLSPTKCALYKGLRRLRGDAGDAIDQIAASK